MNNRCRQPTTGIRRTAGPVRLGRALHLSPLAAAVVSALYPGSQVSAQATDAAKLEEIIVTATRRELNLQKVAQSITAFSTDDIARQGFQSVSDVISALPSVSLVNNQPGRNSIVMRGIATGSEEFRTDSQVAVYLDDQPMTSISQQVEVRPIDLARIEALPGPQGTLFGSSSQSGTLVYITNKPDPTALSGQLDGEVSSTHGGEESYDVSGHVNFPLSDKLAVRAVGYYSVEGGYVDNVLGPTLMGDADNAALVEEDWNDYTVYGGRIAARWQISDRWESTLSLITQESEADGGWESDQELGDYKITRFTDEWRDDSWYQASLNAKGDLGFAELSLTASYFDREIKYEFDNSNYDQWRTAYYGIYVGLPLYDTGTLIGPAFNDQTQDRWAYEVRLTSQGESRFTWMAGAFYEDVYDWWHYGSKIPGLETTVAWEYAQYLAYYYNNLGYDVQYPIPDTDIYYSDKFDKTVKQKAVFGELTFDLTERWSVTGGARWFEYDRKDFEIRNVPLGFPVDSDVEGGGRVDSSGTDSDTIFKASTEYRFDEDRMIYALYSEGFRLGGSNSERAAANGILPLEYGPDTLQNYEAGLKSRWLEDALQLNVSLFFMQWDDIQLNTTGSNAGNPWWMRGTFNGGKAEQKGVEISANWQVTEQFSFEASAFLADPEFSEETVYPDGGSAIAEGTVMPVSPEEKYWLAAEYQFPNFMNLSGNLWTRASYSYQSEIWNDLDAILDYQEAETPEDRAAARDQLIPSSSSTTLQFGFTHDDGWEAALIVRNLFDEDGIDWMSTSDYGNSPNAGFDDQRFRYVRTQQRPRTIGLSFSKKW